MARNRIDASELMTVVQEVIGKEMEKLRAELLEMHATRYKTIISDGTGAGLSVTTAEICRRWGRSRSTLCRLVSEGKLIPVGKYRQSFTFKIDDVTALFGPAVL